MEGGREGAQIEEIKRCVWLFVRRIPPGSDAVIHRDWQTQQRSRVSEALTFRIPLNLLHSFTSS